MLGRLAALFAALLLTGCPDETEEPPPEPPVLFPADYAYSEVRDCRSSGDHDLNHVRVLADAEALGPYNNRDVPFPTGAVVLKEEYDFADMTCSGPLKQWTVMVKMDPGSSEETLDWHWQRVDANRHVLDDNKHTCYACHSQCTESVGGYDYTCAMP